MTAPFDAPDVTSRAEQLGDDLRTQESFRDDIWDDPTLGPLLRVYALLTHRPGDAFNKPVSPEYVAECRTYARLYLAAVYDGLVGAKTFDDEFFELMSEYDSLVDADLESARQAAQTDAAARLMELKKSGVNSRAGLPGSVRPIRRKKKGQ